MDKVAILTASRVEPGVAITAGSHSNLIAVLGPAVQYAVRVQNILSSASVFLCLHAYFLANVTFAGALWASKIVAFQAYVATKLGAFHGLAISYKMATGAWDSKQVQVLRKKLFHEFAVFILGSGNPIILMLFWPGWLVIGGSSWALWQLLG